jgi:hypothetical protein
MDSGRMRDAPGRNEQEPTMKMKGIVVLACCWSVAALSASTLAHAASDPHVFTQTCPNGYALTWAANNPPLPDGVRNMPTGGQIGTDGAFFGDGDVDNNVVCPRDK